MPRTARATSRSLPSTPTSVPLPGSWVEVLDGDAAEFGGSGLPTRARMEAEPVPFHGFAQSLHLVLPPLAALVLAPAL